MQNSIIIVTMRPEMSYNFINAWRNQTQPTNLVIIKNGRAKTHSYPSLDNLYVLKGPMYKWYCLYQGLLKAKELGSTHWLAWDDDDYYGPKYVEHMMQYKSTWFGQISRYMKTEDNKLYKIKGKKYPLGPCLGGSIDMIHYFKDIPNVVGGEDNVSQMLEKDGIDPTPVPPGHFAHVRSKNVNHTWPIKDSGIVLNSGGALDLGPWNEDVVNQIIPEPKGVEVLVNEKECHYNLQELFERKITGIPSKEFV